MTESNLAEFQSNFTCTPIFYQVSSQNDICSFTVVTITLTVRFKLVSYQHFYPHNAMRKSSLCCQKMAGYLSVTCRYCV